MAHKVTVEIDGDLLNQNFEQAKKAYPILGGFSNPRIRPDSQIVVDDDTPAGTVEVTIKMRIPPA